MKNWRVSRKVAAGSLTVLLVLLVVAGSLIGGMLDLDSMRDQDSVRQQSLDEIQRAELEMAGLYAIWSQATINDDLALARSALDRYQARAEPLLARLEALAASAAERNLSAAVRTTYLPYLASIREGLPLVERVADERDAAQTTSWARVTDHDAVVSRLREASARAVGALAEQQRSDARTGAAAFEGIVARSIRWAGVHTLIGVALALLIVVASARSITTPIASVVGSLRRIATGDLSQEIRVGRTDELGDILKASAEMQAALRQSMEAHTLAVQALEENERKFRSIFETMSEGVALNEAVYNEAGEMVDYRILEVNDAFYGTADWAGRTVVGGIATDLYRMSADDIKTFWNEHKTCTTVQHTQMVSPRNGRSFHISTSPFVDHRFVTTFFDVTAMKEAEQTLRDIGERFRLVIDHALDAVIIMNSSGEITVWNRQAETTFGWTRDEAVGRRLLELIVPERYREAHERGIAAFCAGGTGVFVGRRVEIQALRRNGEEFPVELSISAAAEGPGPQFTAFLRDITDRKQAENRLHLAASVFTHAREGITITDPEGTILDVNDTFSTITGYKREEVVGRNPRLLKSNRQDAGFYRGMWDDLARLGYWHGEVWNRRKDGEVYAELLTISAVRDPEGRTQAYVGLFSDITALKEQGRRLEYLAHYDALTTLPNRGLLADRLRQGMAQARRRGQLVAVAYLDLDGFKAVNDAHGHEVGDQLLIALATRMKHASRDGDTLARIGGDEFVALFLDLPDTQSCLPMIERLLSAVSQEAELAHLTLRVSASLGVTFFPQAEDVDADQLLRQADQAMYQAKLAGKGRYHIFDAQQDRSVRGHHEGLDRIRQALREQEFELRYQPKVNMRSGKVMGAEALIRWRHPEKGLLSPSEFLPLVENHPLSADIGEWVMRRTLEQMDEWRRCGLNLPVSLNVGAYQLQQPGFVECMRRMWAGHPGLRPNDLQIEILETSALEDLALVSEVIETCRDFGVSFALDDFGAGYSSLTYLKRLPVSMLKIDQSFVCGMLDDPEDLAILEGVVGLAVAFGREVIAEGVETVEHGEMLLQLGCELAQGFGIARPMPAPEIPGWAAGWKPDVAWPGLAAVSRRDLGALFAAAELKAWVDRIDRHFVGKGEVPLIPNHHHCRFGAWLDAQGRARAHDWPSLQVIEPMHREVHALGQSVCEHRASGRISAGIEHLTELHRCRDALVGHLQTLRREMRRCRVTSVFATTAFERGEIS